MSEEFRQLVADVEEINRHVGRTPGHIPTDSIGRAVVRLVQYDDDRVDVSWYDDPTGNLPARLSPAEFSRVPGGVNWMHVTGSPGGKFISDLRDRFGMHPLLAEDVFNGGQRPKYESYDEWHAVFAVLTDPAHPTYAEEQVVVILRDNVVISFSGSCEFSAVADRIKRGRGRIRRSDAAYLAYALLDTVADGYIVALDAVACRLDELEPLAMGARRDRPSSLLPSLHRTKRLIMRVRKAASPMRDAVTAAARSVPGAEDDAEYFRDLHDHLTRIVESADSYREIVASMTEIHVADVGNRLNEIMRVLTVLTVAFLPATFVTGFFGMNFPALAPVEARMEVFLGAVALMAVAAIAMVTYFRRRN